MCCLRCIVTVSTPNVEVSLSSEAGRVGGELHLPFCLDRIPSFSYSVCGWLLRTALISKGKLWPLSARLPSRYWETQLQSASAFLVSAYNQGHCSLSSQSRQGSGQDVESMYTWLRCMQSHSRMVGCWSFLCTPPPSPLLLSSAFSPRVPGKVMRLQPHSCQTERSPVPAAGSISED